MSCGLILVASLFLSDPSVVEAAAPVAAEAPQSVAGEPLFADLVQRSGHLKSMVEAWMTSGEAHQQGFFTGSPYGDFKRQVGELAARDMEGHENLKARNLDGDLKCILRGISEDLPKRLVALEGAATEAERKQALEELAYLLNDNVEVITAPPIPAV